MADSSAQNSSTGDWQAQNQGITRAEMESLLKMTHTRGFNFGDLVLGMLLAWGIAALLLWWFRKQASHRLFLSNQTAAVQALKDMDAGKLRDILGQVPLPTWLNYPDFERTGFANQMIAQLWPRVARSIDKYYQVELDPLLKSSKPGWISKIKLHRFKMGDQPPQINGIKVYDESHVQDAIVLEVDFTWNGDQDVELIVKPLPKMLGLYTMVGDALSRLITVKAGIEKLVINGRLRVALKPLLDKQPFVGAAQISLIEMPQTSFEVTLYGGNVSMLPGLEAWLDSFLKDTLVRPYVLPEAYVLPFIEGDLAMDKPKGMLLVKVMEAVNVPKMDWLAKADPFVKLSVRASDVSSTQARHFTLHPKWDEEFIMMVHEPDLQKLRLQLFDFNHLDNDEEIGRAYVAIKDLKHGEMQDLWLEVEPHEPSNPSTGDKRTAAKLKKAALALKQTTPKQLLHPRHRLPCRLNLQVSWYRFEGNEAKSLLQQQPGNCDHLDGLQEHACDMLHAGILYVSVRKGVHLVHKPFIKLGFLHTSTTVKVAVAGKEKKTLAVRGKDPGYYTKLEFSLGAKDIQGEDVHIVVEVWDYNHPQFCKGTVEIKLREVREKKYIKQTYSLRGVRHGQILLELQLEPIRGHFC